MSFWPVDPRKRSRLRSLHVGRHIRRYGWPIAAVIVAAAVIAAAGSLAAHADRSGEELAGRTGTGWNDSDRGWSQPAAPPTTLSATARPAPRTAPPPARFATLRPGARLPA